MLHAKNQMQVQKKLGSIQQKMKNSGIYTRGDRSSESRDVDVCVYNSFSERKDPRLRKEKST